MTVEEKECRRNNIVDLKIKTFSLLIYVTRCCREKMLRTILANSALLLMNPRRF